MLLWRIFFFIIQLSSPITLDWFVFLLPFISFLFLKKKFITSVGAYQIRWVSYNFHVSMESSVRIRKFLLTILPCSFNSLEEILCSVVQWLFNLFLFFIFVFFRFFFLLWIFSKCLLNLLTLLLLFFMFWHFDCEACGFLAPQP